jgi:hypothetical protein
LDEWGHKILTAIDQLKGNIAPASSPIPIATTNSDTSNRYLQENPIDCFSIPVESTTPITGIASILSWTGLRSGPSPSPLPTPNHAGIKGQNGSDGRESASTAGKYLRHLSDAFITHYIPTIPILDVTHLKRYLAKIDENGIAWTTESCLVLLVVALGSCGSRDYDQEQCGVSMLGSQLASTITGFRYWNMAKKRLGWALEENSLVSAQCLCLAGCVCTN